ncbi:MAG: hypothetical protein WAK91_12840, partial [Candidatus Acidiferrales bacterium]
MNRRDWCKQTLAGAAALALGVSDELIHASRGTNDPVQTKIRRLIDGNYELTAEISGASAVVSFSGREDWPIDAALEISDGAFVLVRREKGSRLTLKQYEGNGRSPWRVRLLKKGNFFRYWVNSASGWVREPLGVWESDHPTRHCEPARGYVSVESQGGRIASSSVTLLPWLKPAPKPVITAGPDGTFKEAHVLVGGIIEHDGIYYQYFSGSRFGCQEGGGAREIGVAHSRDLREWVVEPEPIIKIGAKGSW